MSKARDIIPKIIKSSNKSEEAFTYLMGHITKEIVHGIQQE